MNAVINDPNTSNTQVQTALQTAIDQINQQIATAGANAESLQNSRDLLEAQLNKILDAATEEALNSPEVLAAADNLKQLSKDMNDTASQMTDATKSINNVNQLITLGNSVLNIFQTAKS
jgi:CRISPR/Cas system-associated endonuclease Cas1